MWKLDDYVFDYEDFIYIVGASVSEKTNGPKRIETELKASHNDCDQLMAKLREFKDSVKQWALQALDAEIAEKFPEARFGASDEMMAKIEFLRKQHRDWAKNLDQQVDYDTTHLMKTVYAE